MKFLMTLATAAVAGVVAIPSAHATRHDDSGWMAGRETPVRATVRSADDGVIIEARRKKRVKGGSGCDDPGDVAEHPECR